MTDQPFALCLHAGDNVLVALRAVPPGTRLPGDVTAQEAVPAGHKIALRDLRRGDHMLRYAAEDDFGAPETAFNVCTFWLIEALALVERREEAREMFEAMLSHTTASGMLSEGRWTPGSSLVAKRPIASSGGPSPATIAPTLRWNSEKERCCSCSATVIASYCECICSI